MERCIHKHLYNYVFTNELITALQSGFKHGDSTNFQVLHTYHSFCEAVDRGKEVRVVFCDISKAFDRVWHKGLLHKLSCMGCSNPIVNWFSSYLSNRRQRGFESAHHFLFTCPRFAAARNTYLPRNLHNYSTRDLLFGSESKSDQQNEAIFLRVQDYLINSTRFSNHH